MSFYGTSVYKGCMTVVITLLLLTGFCLANVEPGTAAYYLCLFSLIVDVPFFGFLLYKLIRHRGQTRKTAEAADETASAESEKVK